jgi:hypothetical protein
MKTTILGMTTAIALALPAVAQTNIENTVSNVLERQGFQADTVDMLSEGQIAEIYVTATSGDQADLQRVLDSYALTGGDVNAMEASPSGVEEHVAGVLDANGYSPDMVNALSSGDIANIYAADTSGSETDVMDAISAAIEASGRVATDDPSAAEERAVTYLSRQGYSMAEIQNVSQTQLMSIYAALTSGNRGDVNDAVTSALEAS